MSTTRDKAAELMTQMQLIVRRYRNRRREFENSMKMDLNHGELEALFWLGMEGESTMSRMAHDVGFTMSNATMTIDRLVRKRIVARRQSPTDRRMVMIRLTAEGNRIFKRIHDHFVEMGEAMLERLTKKEQETILALYRKIASTF
jgi:DNA-binding MarR family transcriptional regulator